MEGEDVRQCQHQRRGTRLRALAGFHVDLKGTRRELGYFAEQVVEVGGHLVHVGGVAEEHRGFRLGVVSTVVTYTQFLEKLLHAGRGIPVGELLLLLVRQGHLLALSYGSQRVDLAYDDGSAQRELRVRLMRLPAPRSQRIA